MKPQRKGSVARIVIVIAVLGGLTAGALAYFRNPKARGAEYKTATVDRGDLVQFVTANGSLTPVRSVEVGSQISGTLQEIKVDFNSRVKAGDLVAQIDPATYERSLLQAKAELANSTAALELARLNYDRAKELSQENLISKSEFDQARVSLSQAEAAVQMREANVERAQVDLTRTTIYAPIDGIVISRKVEMGQTVAASLNAPTLFVIADDLKRMRIEAAVSEADVGGVTEGQKVRFTVDAFQGRDFEGVVEQVRYAPTTNQNVVTYTTIVDVDNRDLKLRPGMTANANIITAERSGVLRIPNAAFRFRPPATGGETNVSAAAGRAGAPTVAGAAGARTPGGGSGRPPGAVARRGQGDGPRTQTVYLVEQGASGSFGEGMELRPVTITLGVSDGTYTEVTEGLKEGDIVATGTITQMATAPAGGTPFGGSPFGGPRPPR